MPTLPGPLNLIGKKHIDLAFKWVPSLAVFGGTAATLGVYFSEWRLIADYIPFYNGKFKETPDQ